MRSFFHTAGTAGLATFAIFALFIAGLFANLIPDIVRNPRDWSQLIGAAVGFIGLGAAALFNAELTRRRDNRLNENSADAIRGALGGELRAIRGYIKKESRYLRRTNVQYDGVASPETIARLRDWYNGTYPRVYEGLQDRMDALSPKECAYLAYVHSRLYRHRSRILRLIDQLTARDPQPSHEAVQSTAEKIVTTKVPQRIDETFRVLDAHAHRDLSREVPEFVDGRPSPPPRK